MAKATLTLFLRFLALTSTLSFNAEARPQPSDEDTGTIIGPYTTFDEDTGTIVGPYTTFDEDVGTLIGPEFEVHRKDFPEDFIFGTSVSAYQVEGAKKGSGRGLTTWDEFTHMYPAEQNHSPHLKSTSMGIVIYPEGLRKLLKHIKDEYMDPEIYIMENGMDELDDGKKNVTEAVNDYGRKEFIKSHVLIMGKSIRLDNVKLKGYFIWSLMDNLEWERGYRNRFGLYYVDFNDNMKRHIRSLLGIMI